jgi:hypothetical protein
MLVKKILNLIDLLPLEIELIGVCPVGTNQFTLKALRILDRFLLAGSLVGSLQEFHRLF